MKTAEEFLEELQIQLDKKLPFVAFRKPGEVVGSIKAFLQYDNNLHITKDFSESGFVFAPFDDNEDAVLIPQEHSRYIETAFNFSEADEVLKNHHFSHESDVSAKDQHQELVQRAVEKIRSGGLKKVVVSRREGLEIQNYDPLNVFRKLLNKYDTAYVYCWYHPQVGFWLGATPETLLSIERDRFKTVSLAGTQNFSGTTEVSWGEKEKEEQKIVTDSILENLLDLSIQSVETSLPYTVKAGNLLHIKTDITGNLNSKSQIPNSNMENGLRGKEAGLGISRINLKELIAAIHPTPAVCGLPKEAAKQFILKNENYDREFYTGFLGELNIKNEVKRNSNRRNQENQAYAAVVRSSAIFVNLRCMKLEGDKAYLYVGGGITKDSNSEAEWEETRNKSQTMKAVL